MAGVHGLEHVDDLLAARLADDDPVGPHPQGVFQTVSGRHLALAFDVGRAAFHPAHVGLLQLEFGRILDREDPFGIVDEGTERVERRGFTRTGTARHDDVEAGGHGGLKVGGHFLGKGAELHQVVDAQLVLFEFPDGNEAAVHRDGGHHGVEARAVLEAGVDVRVGFVHAPAHGGHDLVDDPQQVAFVLEGDVGQFQLARAFHEDLLRAVDQNIVDRLILEQGFERTEAHHLVKQFLVQDLTVLAVEDDVLFLKEFRRNRLDFLTQIVFGRGFQRREVQVVEQGAVQFEFDLAHPLFFLALLIHRQDRGGTGIGLARDLGRGGRGLGRFDRFFCGCGGRCGCVFFVFRKH